MATTDEPAFDPRRVLASIADDAGATPVHRLRALRLYMQGEPKQRRSQEPEENPVISRAVELMAEWARRPDAMPTDGQHHGVPFHSFQSADRIEAVVKPAMDRVLEITEPVQLFAVAGDLGQPPECRMLAHALYQAQAEQRSQAHEQRLGRLEQVAAYTCGLSVRWSDPSCYASLLDTWSPGSPGPPRRPSEFARQLEEAQDSE
jgi:hypothetical protein